MHNINQINENLKKEIAIAVKELAYFPDGLITITWVECDPNFATARIGISVLPDGLAGSALEALKKASGEISKSLRGRLRIRKIPHFIWKFDPTEKNADSIEKTFYKIEQNIEDEEEINFQ